MEVVLSKVMMAAVMALLAITQTSAVVVFPTSTVQTTTKGLGNCPDLTTLAGFTKANFDGAWFVYQQTPNLIEASWTCKQVTYSETTNAFTYAFRTNGLQTSYIGTYNVPTAGTGAITVALQYMLALGADSFGRVNQFVVAGEADAYMIIRSCTNYGIFNHQYVYVLTRQRVPADAVQTTIAAALNTAGINGAALQTVVQAGC